MPRAWRALSVLVALFHTHFHRAFELRPDTVLKVLERADAFRRPERFDDFLTACEADARGRLGLEERRYDQADYLRGAAASARSVDAGAIAKDVGGKRVAEAIRRARIDALTTFKSAYEPR